MANLTPNKIIERFIMAGLWSVLLLPFIVTDNMLFPYITGKNFAFRLIVEIIFSLWVYLTAVEPKYRPRFSPVALALGTFLFIMALADIFAVDPAKAIWGNYERMDGLVTLLHLTMCFFVAGAFLKTEKAWLWFFKSSVAASMLMVILVVREWLYTSGDRVAATLGNPIYLAVYFLFNFFFALLLLHREFVECEGSSEPLKTFFTQWLTYIYPLAASACAFGIWRTASRGVILGLLGGLLTTSAIISFHEKKSRLIRNLFLGTAIMLAALVAGFIAIKNTEFIQNEGTLKRLADMSWTQAYGQTKRDLWVAALKGLRERPALGWGQEGFSIIYDKYSHARMYNQEQWFDRAHNIFLDVLAAGGLLGLSAYLSVFIASALVLTRKKNRFRTAELGLLTGLLAAYLLQGLFIFDHLISYLFFFFVLAYMHSRDTRDEAGVERTALPMAAKYAAAPVLAAIFLPMLWYCCIKPISAGAGLVKAMVSPSGQTQDPESSLKYFRKVFRTDSFGSPEAREILLSMAPGVQNTAGIDRKVKQEFSELASAQASLRNNRSPYHARDQYFAGVFFNKLNQYEEALPYLQKAAGLAPENLPVLLELTKCYSYLGQYEKALETAGYAYQLNPEYNPGKKNYARALKLNGKDLQAKELLGRRTAGLSR